MASQRDYFCNTTVANTTCPFVLQSGTLTLGPNGAGGWLCTDAGILTPSAGGTFGFLSLTTTGTSTIVLAANAGQTSWISAGRGDAVTTRQYLYSINMTPTKVTICMFRVDSSGASWLTTLSLLYVYDQCPMGQYYVPGLNTTSNGTLTSPSSTSSCVACPLGSGCPGYTDIIKCPPGTYANATGANCIACPTGSYSSVSGSATCTACPAGSYCPTRGAGDGTLPLYSNAGSGVQTNCNVLYLPAAWQYTLNVSTVWNSLQLRPGGAAVSATEGQSLRDGQSLTSPSGLFSFTWLSGQVRRQSPGLGTGVVSGGTTTWTAGTSVGGCMLMHSVALSFPPRSFVPRSLPHSPCLVLQARPLPPSWVRDLACFR